MAGPRTKNSKAKSPRKLLIIFGISIPVVTLLVFLGILLAVGPHRARSGFKTLAQMSLYAKLVDESKAQMENNNPVKPEYPTFFASMKIGFFGARFRKLKALLGRPVEPWTAETYKTYVEALGKARKDKGSVGSPVHKVVMAPTSKIIVWGDLQGSFHSLVRTLEHLATLGVIGDDLKLKSTDDFLVFLGDAVSRSAFSMETVTAVGAIMAQNPYNTFYIRGNHETNNYWHGYGFKDELQAKAGYLSKETIPLEGITNEFFATLPVAVYFGMPPEVNQSFLRVSHESANDSNRVAKIDESKLAKFLTTPTDQKVSNINLDAINPADAQSQSRFLVRAFIKSEIKRDTYQAMDGMRQTLPENGAATWTMLSCPSEIFQKGLSYFYDCFAIIAPGATFDQWTIELHKQDVRTMDGFKTRKHFLLSGQEVGAARITVASAIPAQGAAPGAPATQSSPAGPIQSVQTSPPIAPPADTQAVVPVPPATMPSPAQVLPASVPVAPTTLKPQPAQTTTALPVPTASQTQVVQPIQPAYPEATADRPAQTPGPIAPPVQTQALAPVQPVILQPQQAQVPIVLPVPSIASPAPMNVPVQTVPGQSQQAAAQQIAN